MNTRKWCYQGATEDYYFDVEKKDSIVTLLLTLWKSETENVTKTESGELGSAVSAYINMIQADHSIVPCFNTFYEYMRDVYRQQLAERDIKVEKEDFNIDNFLTTLRQYYKGGRYDFLLNSKEKGGTTILIISWRVPGPAGQTLHPLQKFHQGTFEYPR